MSRFILVLLLLVFTKPLLAKINLPSNCDEYKEVAQSNFVLLNKKELIQLGECIAQVQLKTKKIDWISDSCEEISEDEKNIFGVLSLSKVDAIQIGMCLGVINTIYTRFDGAYVYQLSSYSSYRRSNKKYRCLKGEPAISKLIKLENQILDIEQIRDELCAHVYG
ncbi:hypothetical protein WCN91_13310 [Pseudoalteromonas sp. YIC-827]|uniref:YARHG domain-containing protein n=1 Tax=Pseudoalteromonas qingdaonensis TaxID=3131913 RepID=A0ABU9N3Y0_9GAMM